MKTFRRVAVSENGSTRLHYNRSMLVAALADTLFTELPFPRYGESDLSLLRGPDRHEKWTDTPELPHVLIVETSGRTPRPLSEQIRKGFEERPLDALCRLAGVEPDDRLLETLCGVEGRLTSSGALEPDFHVYAGGRAGIRPGRLALASPVSATR